MGLESASNGMTLYIKHPWGVTEHSDAEYRAGVPAPRFICEVKGTRIIKDHWWQRRTGKNRYVVQTSPEAQHLARRDGLGASMNWTNLGETDKPLDSRLTRRFVDGFGRFIDQ